MKVDFSAKINLYQKNSAVTTKNTSAKPEAKTDVAAFSRGHTAMADKRLIGLKSSLQADLSASAEPDRIAELHQQVKNGTYRIPTEDLVNSIMRG